MSGVTRILGSVRWFVAWSVLVFPTLAWGQEATLVQQIGELASEVADAVAAEVEVVPFSPAIDARTTPIIVAPGQAFVHQRRQGQVGGLSGAERKAIRQAYAAGQTILLLPASVHDIEALHVLVKEGVTHRSSSDPTILAYALRQESDIPTVRVVHDLRPSLRAPGGIGPDFEDEGALQRALDVIISELIHPPVLGAPPPPVPGAADWKESPVQTNIITSTSNGIYNTPVDIYALHSCLDKHDYYLVNTGGTWTATEATFLSASEKAGQISLPRDNGDIVANFESDDTHCTGGINAASGIDRLLCRYTPYPLWYEVDILPPDGPRVIQLNAKPAGNQGVSSTYTSGFSWSSGGGVDISGDGPSGGIQVGVTWSNDVSTTTVPLLLSAGDRGNQGTFTRYQYCTVGNSLANCDSNIKISNPPNDICHDYIVQQPQQGQTPNGRLSDVAQTVQWQVDPTTYGGSTTFDVTVTWQVDMAFSQAMLWWGEFLDRRNHTDGGPLGSCNSFGCSCSMPFNESIDTHSLTFKVPFPSQKCTSG